MKKYIGKTILFAVHVAGQEGAVNEGQVNRLSPSGKYVEIGYGWYEAEKVSVLEELAEIQQEATEKTEPVPPSEKASEPVSEKASEPVSEKASEPVSEKASEPVSEKASEPVSEKASEPVSESPVPLTDPPTLPPSDGGQSESLVTSAATE